MSFPAGCVTRPLTAHAPFAEDGTPLDAELVITASARLVFAANGQPMQPTYRSNKVDPATGLLTMPVPTTNQASGTWLDGNGNAVASDETHHSHTYSGTLTYTDAQTGAVTVYALGPFVVPVADGSPFPVEGVAEYDGGTAGTLFVPDVMTVALDVAAAQQAAADAVAAMAEVGPFIPTVNPDGTLTVQAGGTDNGDGTITIGGAGRYTMYDKAAIDAALAAIGAPVPSGGVLGVEAGGTGASTPGAALVNLGGMPAVAQGGGGNPDTLIGVGLFLYAAGAFASLPNQTETFVIESINAGGRFLQRARSLAGNLWQRQTLAAGNPTGSASWSPWGLLVQGVTSFVPTLTNFTLGNGTVAAQYSVSGGRCFVDIQINLGSTSVVGDVRVTNPVPMAGAMGIAHGTGRAVHGAVSYMLYVATTTTLTGLRYTTTPSGGGPTAQANLSATAPATWAAGDIILISYSYPVI